MKHLGIAFCMLMTASGNTVIKADPIQPNVEYQGIRKENTPQSPARPRMPSNEYIGFAYEYDACIFSVPGYITSMQVTIQDENGQSWTTSIMTSYPVWQITLNPGEYFIECVTDDNSTFSGYIYIQS